MKYFGKYEKLDHIILSVSVKSGSQTSITSINLPLWGSGGKIQISVSRGGGMHYTFRDNESKSILNKVTMDTGELYTVGVKIVARLSKYSPPA